MTSMERDLQNVIAFALADGDLAEEEKAYVQALRRQMGIDDETFQHILDGLNKNPKTLKLPKEPERVEELVHLLVQAAASDHDVGDTERKLLGRIAQRAGISPEEIDQRIAQELQLVGNDTLVPADDGPADAVIEQLSTEIYTRFATWDDATRQAKLAELTNLGTHGVIPLLRLLESYRVPDGETDALALKTMVVKELGELRDKRAVYYLIQQVSIGDGDDEITCLMLRAAAAQAVGRILGQDKFTADQAGIDAVRSWWVHNPTGREEFDRLAM
jgi:DnaJ-domain-containing protein 1